MKPTKSSETEVRAGSGEMFDRIAARYDLLNRVVSLGLDQGWRRRTVRALGIQNGHRVLDLATGTADLAIMIARCHPEATVVGVDPSRNMLAIGERKIARAGLAERITLQYGHAESLEFPDGSFDAVCMAFGIRNVSVSRREVALKEMARVTRTGGRVAILELCEPRKGALGPLARFYVHSVVPRLGAMLSGETEYRYLEQSIAAFPSPEAFAGQMEASGLRVLDLIPLTFGVSCLYVATPSRGEG